ncbi:MAG: prolyl oligopeptidase family serine peptidase, partial [Myxococcales bacterium]|nr:prolyl oligopeptidase family serine peptidase [Myxococcales bacterium]
TAPEGVTGAPLILGLHGGGMEGGDKGRRLGASSGFSELAEREGFVAAYPSSYAGNWDDGRDAPFVPPEGISDLDFIEAVIDDIDTRVGIDRDRVYVTGASNGGFMTNHLACQRTELFAAFANVIGGMPTDYVCEPQALAPMLLMPGTADPLVPYEGGAVAGEDEESGQRGSLIPQTENQAFWRDANNCTGDPVVTSRPDTATEDGSTVREERWTACDGDSEVLSLIVEGGGHTWPGGTQYAPVALIGTVNRDIVAQDEIWAFFQRHSR